MVTRTRAGYKSDYIMNSQRTLVSYGVSFVGCRLCWVSVLIVLSLCLPSGALDGETFIEELGEKQRHQLKHRELFLSRQVETLPATHIRGKCAVTLLNETESLMSYLNKDVSSADNIRTVFYILEG